MRKNKSTLPVKGLNAPFLWCRGFLHGKLLHTGGIHPETGVISSGYITGQLSRFQSACALRMKELEASTAEAWKEADRLALEYRDIPAEPDDQNSADALREAEKAADKRITILRQLSDIRSDIHSACTEAEKQCEATAKLMLSNFARYGHGLLLKIVSPDNLPEIPIEISQFYTNHTESWNNITNILKEAAK